MHAPTPEPTDPTLFTPTFGFPIWEILATALVSGVVTAVTVFWSIRSARRETERVLAQDREAGRGPAIAALLQSFSAIVAEGREEIFYDPRAYPGWSLAASALRLTRTPYVAEVIEWADQMAWFFEFHSTNTLSFLGGQALSAAEANPTLYVSERLAEWDRDPIGQGRLIESELPELRSRHWFTTDPPFAPIPPR